MKLRQDSNAKTLLAYEKNPQLFIDGTPKDVEGDVKLWLNKATTGLNKTSSILELGSGPGRDASYLESFGYKVQRSDGATSFVEAMRKSGHEAKLINAITDELGGPYDLVLANCVFLHFQPDEFEHVLDKIARSLNPRGLLAFSIKRGTGSGWSNKKVNAPRFFQYWTKDATKKLLGNHGYTVRDLWDGSLIEEDLGKIYVIATKTN